MNSDALEDAAVTACAASTKTCANVTGDTRDSNVTSLLVSTIAQVWVCVKTKSAIVLRADRVMIVVPKLV